MPLFDQIALKILPFADFYIVTSMACVLVLAGPLRAAATGRHRWSWRLMCGLHAAVLVACGSLLPFSDALRYGGRGIALGVVFIALISMIPDRWLSDPPTEHTDGTAGPGSSTIGAPA